MSGKKAVRGNLEVAWCLLIEIFGAYDLFKESIGLIDFTKTVTFA